MIEKLLSTAKGGKGSKLELDKRESELASSRSGYLERAKVYSSLTVTHMFPDVSASGDSGGTKNQGYSSLGSQLVNGLANKLTITLFPPQSSFFRMEFSDELNSALVDSGYDVADLQKILAMGESGAMKVFATRECRTAIVEAMKGLIVSGNVCLYYPPDKSKPAQAIPMNRYYTRRDRSGFVIEYLQTDKRIYSSLSDSEKDLLRPHKSYTEKDDLPLLTWAIWTGNKYTVLQTLDKVLLSDPVEVSKSDLPWIPLTWTLAYGEDYGRGMVESNYSDFYTTHYLSESRAVGAALAADIKILVANGSMIDIDQFESAPSGTVLIGRENDVSIIQAGAKVDFNYISVILKEYEQRLGRAFLVASTHRRDAERVTAQELRMDAQELETSLGGIYSMLADSLQAPLAWMLFKEIELGLDNSELAPSIITGMEALGRIGDLEKIARFSEMLQIPNTWPETVQQRIKWGEYLNSVQASLSLNASWLMTDEEFESQQQAQAEAQEQAMVAGAMTGAATGALEAQLLGTNK